MVKGEVQGGVVGGARRPYTSPPIFLKIDFFLYIQSLQLQHHRSMPVLTRSSSNRQQNITNTNTNNPLNLPLTTPNVPTVPVPPMAPKAPLKKLSHDLDLESEPESKLGYCCICCDEIQCEKGRFVLDCGHTFHGNCILRSFKHDNRCPMCRVQVDAADKNLDYLFPTALRINSSIISLPQTILFKIWEV